jgi:hypothetical protein
MGAGELKCFKKIKKLKNLIFFSKKFQSPPPPTMARGSVALQSPHPHGGAVMHDGSSVGVRGLARNRATNQIFIYFYFLVETFQSLLKHGASCKCHPRSKEIHLSMAKEVSSRS